METIFIPKISILTKDMHVFSDLKRFCEVTGFVPDSVYSATSGPHQPAQKGNILSRMFRNVGNRLLSTTRKGYDIMDEDEHYNKLFSTMKKEVVREKKKALLTLINRHEKALRNLAEARSACWISEAKMKKYDLIVSTKKTALLEHDWVDKDAREKTLHEMKMFERWAKVHEKDQEEFKKKFLIEFEYRDKIAKLAEQLQSDVVARIQTTIHEFLTANNQHISEEESASLSMKLYKQSCRFYIFPLVKNAPCQKVWIQKPKYEPCKKEWIQKPKNEPCQKVKSESRNDGKILKKVPEVTVMEIMYSTMPLYFV